MPIRFGPSSVPFAREVLTFYPDSPIWLVAGSDLSFDTETMVHWLPKFGRNVPCTHEDCPWCPLPKDPRCYVPVMAYLPKTRVWRESVLTLTERMFDFRYLPREKVVYEFCRYKTKNAKINWKRMDVHKFSNPFAGFDPIPSLMKIWGQYGKAKKTADRPDVERPRLFDDRFEQEAC